MYIVKQIRSAANSHIIGGLIAVVVGIISQYLAETSTNPNPDLFGIAVNHLITLVIFGIGFLLLHTVGSSTIYQQMVKGQGSKGQLLLRLKNQPDLGSRKPGLNASTLDLAGMFFAIVLIFVVTVLLQNKGGIPLGGFVGGWLIGNAANQFRFSSKVAEEQIEQGRIFYFSDASIGPRTQVSYFQVDPTKDRDVPKVETAPKQALPGLVQPNKKTSVTRRTARINDANLANPRLKAKAEPLVRTSNSKKKEE